MHKGRETGIRHVPAERRSPGEDGTSDHPGNGVPRILFLDHAATPGGGQLALLWLLEGSTRFEPEVLFVAGGPVLDRLRGAGIAARAVFIDRPFGRLLLCAAIPTLFRALRRPELDAVVVTSAAVVKIASLIPLRRRTTRLVYLQEDLDRFRGRGLFSTFLFRFAYPAFDGLIANSDYTARTVPPGLAPLGVEVAYPPSGVCHAPETGTARRFAEDGVVRIGSFSRPIAWKGLDILIEAVGIAHRARPHTRLRLDLYGGSAEDPAHLARLRAAAEQAAYPCALHGHVDDVATPMAASDIVVVPSRLPEPFGQVVAQAVSRGRVVIISGHGGAIEQVEREVSGLHFAPGSADDLAAQIVRLLDEPELAGRLSRGAVARARQRDDAVLVRSLEDAILRSIARTGTGRIARRLRYLFVRNPW
jgi:glycosyltransferase involved in cell wall biosynthesis